MPYFLAPQEFGLWGKTHTHGVGDFGQGKEVFGETKVVSTLFAMVFLFFQEG